MGNWIVHIVGETIDDDIAPIISKAVEEIQKLNHRVKSIRLTTDAGERVIHVTQEVEAAADTVATDIEKDVPPLAPEAEGVDAALHVVGDGVTAAVDAVEKAEGTPLPDDSTTAPVTSATPEVDTTSTPTPEAVETSPVDPPLAGASSTESNRSSTTLPVPTPIPSTKE